MLVCHATGSAVARKPYHSHNGPAIETTRLQKTRMPPPYQAMVPLWNKKAGRQELDLVNFMLLPEILET
eukprot:3390368-Pyramimonas_sp.AAC.1